VVTKPAGSASPLLRDILIEAGLIALLALVFVLAMKVANRRLGLAEPGAEDDIGATSAQTDSLLVPQISAPQLRQSASEGPEAGWSVTPCSLFTSAGSDAVLVQLPQAPTGAEIPYEALLLVRAWARQCGTAEEDLQKVWVFNSNDTVYVDLPSMLDQEGLRRTLEARFVCFTRLFVLVGGNLDSSQDGIALRGVPGGLVPR